MELGIEFHLARDAREQARDELARALLAANDRFGVTQQELCARIDLDAGQVMFSDPVRCWRVNRPRGLAMDRSRARPGSGPAASTGYGRGRVAAG